MKCFSESPLLHLPQRIVSISSSPPPPPTSGFPFFRRSAKWHSRTYLRILFFFLCFATHVNNKKSPLPKGISLQRKLVCLCLTHSGDLFNHPHRSSSFSSFYSTSKCHRKGSRSTSFLWFSFCGSFGFNEMKWTRGGKEEEERRRKCKSRSSVRHRPTIRKWIATTRGERQTGSPWKRRSEAQISQNKSLSGFV